MSKILVYILLFSTVLFIISIIYSASHVEPRARAAADLVHKLVGAKDTSSLSNLFHPDVDVSMTQSDAFISSMNRYVDHSKACGSQPGGVCVKSILISAIGHPDHYRAPLLKEKTPDREIELYCPSSDRQMIGVKYLVVFCKYNAKEVCGLSGYKMIPADQKNCD